MAEVDEENPAPPPRKALGIFTDPDPAFNQTAISVVANVMFSNMALFGFTGNMKMAYLASLVTIPASLYMGIQDAQKDFEKWKQLKTLRARGVPERFMPHKTKYDWTEYEQRMIEREAEKVSSS
uniref:HIG1 domain-containing protein n=1 Tax=Steinernema glaseri TaxID=37863 RepID=A0A1I7YI01_9BILA